MNLGAGEIVLLAILALLLFGPKRLPEIGRQVGRAIAEVRKVSREFEREVRDATEPFAKEVREAEQQARKTYAVDSDFSSFDTPSAASSPSAPPTTGSAPATGPAPPAPEDAPTD